MNPLHWLLDGTIPVAGGVLMVREVVGNLFGLGSALLGMRRLVWAWPVGLVGNVLLFTVFVSGQLDGHTTEPLWGQAGRQVLFAAVSLYGWVRWARGRHHATDGGAVAPRWASGTERLQLLAVAVVGYAASWLLLQWIGSYGPLTEAWILAGSMIATWGMARGWIEFWGVWIAVDAVGVTSLVRAGYYPTAAMYLFYGAFCLVGLLTWIRATRTVTEAPADTTAREEALA